MAAVDLKLVLLGHKNVGKTSIFNRYVYDEFGKTSMTIGAYFGMKQLKSGDRMVNLAIWDTAGEEKFDSLTNFYCRNAVAAVICYDITQADTFQSLQRWVDKILNEADADCSIIIVGNKLDMVEANPGLRRVDLGEAKRYAASINAQVLECSAKTGANVADAFQQVVNLAVTKNPRRSAASAPTGGVIPAGGGGQGGGQGGQGGAGAGRRGRPEASSSSSSCC